ncbi:hypothetical protein NPA07_04385 [Mycoplasmopsis caviae]|uniref:Uncharacterized protein n=1 Tax=Mycoplasmopsis caviae TaxID=55603 RepID=A0A3P8KX75_9BACT|nr:hypothetical protein [Mycoplasmopsis caviae]UUD35016.1 hypothetical protein NPA07_04385 [Mycoplasmopsis caviae]VDR42157.1 Uncharacterised protein [Mycoplasmopsis caviae]
MIKNRKRKAMVAITMALSLTTAGVVGMTTLYNLNSWSKISFKYTSKTNEVKKLDPIRVRSGSTWEQVFQILQKNEEVKKICIDNNWRIDEYTSKINDNDLKLDDKFTANKTVYLNFVPTESRQVNVDLHFYFTKNIIDWSNSNIANKINFEKIKDELTRRFKSKLINFGEKVSKVEAVKGQVQDPNYDVVILKVNNLFINSGDPSVESKDNTKWTINLKKLFLAKGFIKEETFKIENNNKINVDYPFYSSEHLKDQNFRNSAVFGNESNKVTIAKDSVNTYAIRYDISPRIKINNIGIDLSNANHINEINSLLTSNTLADIKNKEIFKNNNSDEELLPPEKFAKLSSRISYDDFITSYAENRKYNTKLVSANINSPLVNLYFIWENILYKVPEFKDEQNEVYKKFKLYWESSNEGEIHFYTNVNLYTYSIKVLNQTFKVKRKIENGKWTLGEEDFKRLVEALKINDRREWFEQNVPSHKTFYRTEDLKKYIVDNNINLSFIDPSQNDTKYEKINISFVGRNNENSDYEQGTNGSSNRDVAITSLNISVKNIASWEKDGRSKLISELNKRLISDHNIHNKIISLITNQYINTSNNRYYTEDLNNVNYKVVDCLPDIANKTLNLSFAKFMNIKFAANNSTIEPEVFKETNKGFSLNYYDSLEFLTERIGKDQNYPSSYILNQNGYGLFLLDASKSGAYEFNTNKDYFKMPIWKYDNNSAPLSIQTNKNVVVETKWISAKVFYLGNNKYILMPNLEDDDTRKIVREYVDKSLDLNDKNAIFKAFVTKYIVSSNLEISKFTSLFENILLSTSSERKSFYYDNLTFSNVEDKFNSIINFFYPSNSQSSSQFFNNFPKNEFTYQAQLQNTNYTRVIKNAGQLVNEVIQNINLDKSISVTYNIAEGTYRFNNTGLFSTGVIDNLVNALFSEKNNIFKYPSVICSYEKCKSDLVLAIQNDIKNKLINPYVKTINNETNLSNINIKHDINYPLEYKDKNIKIHTLEQSSLNSYDEDAIKGYLTNNVTFVEFENGKWEIIKNDNVQKTNLINEIISKIKAKIGENSQENCAIILKEIFNSIDHNGKTIKLINALQFIDKDLDGNKVEVKYLPSTLNETDFNTLISSFFDALNNKNLFKPSTGMDQKTNFTNDFENLLKNINVVNGDKITLRKSDFENVEWTSSLDQKVFILNAAGYTKTFVYKNVVDLQQLIVDYLKKMYDENIFGIFEIHKSNTGHTTRSMHNEFATWLCKRDEIVNNKNIYETDIYGYLNDFKKYNGFTSPSSNYDILIKKYKEVRWQEVDGTINSLNYFNVTHNWHNFIKQINEKIKNLPQYKILSISINGTATIRDIELLTDTNINNMETNDNTIINIDELATNSNGYLVTSLKNRQLDKYENIDISHYNGKNRLWFQHLLFNNAMHFSNSDSLNKLINNSVYRNYFNDYTQNKKSLFQSIKDLLDTNNHELSFLFFVNNYLQNNKVTGTTHYLTFNHSNWNEQNIINNLFNKEIKDNFDDIYNFLLEDPYGITLAKLVKSKNIFNFMVEKNKLILKVKNGYFNKFINNVHNATAVIDYGIENLKNNNSNIFNFKSSDNTHKNIDELLFHYFNGWLNTFLDNKIAEKELIFYKEFLGTNSEFKYAIEEKPKSENILSKLNNTSYKQNILNNIKDDLLSLVFEYQYFKNTQITRRNNGGYNINFDKSFDDNQVMIHKRILNYCKDLNNQLILKEKRTDKINKQLFLVDNSGIKKIDLLPIFYQCDSIKDNNYVDNIIYLIDACLRLNFKKQIAFYDATKDEWYRLDSDFYKANKETIYKKLKSIVINKLNENTGSIHIDNFISEFNKNSETIQIV